MLLVPQHCREANIICYRLPGKDEPCDLWDYSTQFFFTDLLADPLEQGLFFAVKLYKMSLGNQRLDG